MVIKLTSRPLRLLHPLTFKYSHTQIFKKNVYTGKTLLQLFPLTLQSLAAISELPFLLPKFSFFDVTMQIHEHYPEKPVSSYSRNSPPLCSPEVHYSIHKRTLPAPILSQINPTHNHQFSTTQIHSHYPPTYA